MDKQTLARVSAQVARSFPEMAGVAPTIRSQPAAGDLAQYLLVYKAKALLPDGRQMPRVVRVVADDQGRIVRMSTSK